MRECEMSNIHARKLVCLAARKLRNVTLTNEEEEDFVSMSGEHLFYECTHANIYRQPISTGAALAREKLARLR